MIKVQFSNLIKFYALLIRLQCSTQLKNVTIFVTFVNRLSQIETYPKIN